MRRLNSPVVLYPILALILLAGGAAIYLFPWVSSREADLDGTALRSLAATADQISQRMGSMAQVLDALRRHGRNNAPTDANEYLRAQAPTFQSESDCQRAQDRKAISLAVVERIDGHRFQVSDSSNCISANLTSVIEPLLPTQGIFQELILANQHGDTLYQSALTGFRATELSALLEQVHVPAADKTSSPQHQEIGDLAAAHELRIGDTDYRLYLMPVPLSGLVDPTGGRATLILAGITQSAEFRSIALAQSETVFIWVVLLGLLVLFVSWPLLKFTRMGRTERVPRWSALLLLSSVLASTGLATLLVLHASYLSDPSERQETTTRLRQIAVRINQNAESELRSMLAGLRAAEDSPLFRNTRLDTHTGPEPDFQPNVRESVLNQMPVFFSTYPYFEDIFWADAFGNQLVKWTAHPIVTPQTNLSRYVFFQETIHGNLWTFRPCSTEINCLSQHERFRVDPVYSPNSGAYVAIVSTRFDPPAGPLSGLTTASISSRLASLMDPVLPADYGFVILDRTGTILFHSSSGPNIARNFYSDSKDSNLVRAAADSRTPQNLRMDYQGEPHDFFVTPITSIRDCPWTLIVFRKVSALSAKHVERMLLFFAFVILYGLSASLIGLVAALHLPPYPGRWAWPEPSRNPEYLQLAIVLLIIYGAALEMEFSGDWRIDVLVSFCCGLGGFAVTWLHLNGRPGILAVVAFLLAVAAVWFGLVPLAIIAAALVTLMSRNIRRLLKKLTIYESGPARCYTLGAVSLIFLSGVLPCVGFFKIADDFQNVKFLMRDELVTLSQLESRAHNLRDRYASILAGRNEIKGAYWDLPRAMFLRSRLASRWDRFDFMENSTWTYGAPDISEGAAWKLIQWVAARTTWVPNRGAELSRGATLDACPGTGGPICWSLEDHNRLRITRLQGNDANQLADLSSDETADLPDSLVTTYSKLAGLNGYATAGLALLGVGLFLWLRSSLGRLFLLDVEVERPWPVMTLDEATSGTRNILAIALPGTVQIEMLSRRTDWEMMDAAEQAPQAKVEGNGKGIIVTHFDALMESLDEDRGIGRVEELLTTGRPVLLLSHSDPSYRLKQWTREALADPKRFAIASRWETVLGVVQTVTLAPTGSPRSVRFESIWSSCTVPERVALYQLARDGWVNHKNKDALVQLCKRGLVIRDPVCKISDESLRACILTRVGEEQARTWSREEGPSTWDGLRIVIGIAGVAILALLFFWAQQRGLAILTAGLSAAGSAAKVVAEFRGRKLIPGKDSAA